STSSVYSVFRGVDDFPRLASCGTPLRSMAFLSLSPLLPVCRNLDMLGTSYLRSRRSSASVARSSRGALLASSSPVPPLLWRATHSAHQLLLWARLWMTASMVCSPSGSSLPPLVNCFSGAPFFLFFGWVSTLLDLVGTCFQWPSLR